MDEALASITKNYNWSLKSLCATTNPGRCIALSILRSPGSQIWTEPLLAGVCRVETSAPFEGAKILQANFARIAVVVGRIVVGASVWAFVIIVSRVRTIGLIGNDCPGDDTGS